MKITKKFKQLTSCTYPHGTEKNLVNLLPKGYKEDGLGNYYLEIGDEPSTMFACHLDTVGGKKQLKVTHVQNNQTYIETDGKTILGADDKAGMVVMLYMIEKQIPGLYYFFVGEECGCIGSGDLSRVWETTEYSKYIKKMISFDRKGTTSIITKQFYERTCSDNFAKDLASKLNDTGFGFKFEPDPTGLFTDSAEFSDLIPECTNISVGYFGEHTCNETQNIDFLIKLCKSACKIGWESLKVERDPDVYDIEDYYGGYGTYATIDDDEFSWSGENYSYFLDDDDESIVRMFISDEKIEEEEKMIFDWLEKSGTYPGLKSIIWNGNSLTAETDSFDYVGDRYDIALLLPELANTPMKHLKKSLNSYAW